jgi:hypothetical protein
MSPTGNGDEVRFLPCGHEVKNGGSIVESKDYQPDKGTIVYLNGGEI